MKSVLLRFRGPKGTLYYVECYPDETMADIKKLLADTYKLEFEMTFKDRQNNILPKDWKVSDIKNPENNVISVLSSLYTTVVPETETPTPLTKRKRGRKT